MASSKRTGFFLGEEKITLVEFKKKSPLQAVSSPSSPNLTEETQITAVFQKMLQDNRIAGDSFYVSLPMKEIILRSFVIPFVKPEDIQNTIKFEARKYLPLDIQELTYIFYTVPLTEMGIERLQIVFFAVRKETLARYERIFKQAGPVISYAEPCVVSLTKVLLFKKEINLSDHLAFLILDKNSGSIFFIDRGIPQFIREFSISSGSPSEETKDPAGIWNSKVANEVGNSFDFYARQFGGAPVEQILFSSEAVGQELLDALEAELKVKLRKFSQQVTMGALSKTIDMDTMYAMGACVEAPLESLSGFNFLEDKTPKSKFQTELSAFLKSYKEIIFVFLICVISLVGVFVLFQVQLKVAQQQYDQLSSRQGAFLSTPVESIQADLQQNIDKLAAYKNIRTRSDVVLILLRIASHLPQGALLQELSVSYADQSDSNLSQGVALQPLSQGGPNNIHVTIDMKGIVLRGDPNEQIAVINQIFSDFKNDKELSRFVKSVNLVSLIREASDSGQVMGFTIKCS